MSARFAAMLAGCALGLVPATDTYAQNADTWEAQQQAAGAKADRALLEANAQKGLLAQYLVLQRAYEGDHSQAFRLIFGQYISWYLSFLGDYPHAVASFSITQPLQPSDNPSPLTPGSGYTARHALDAIPELAKNYRIVLLNEAHNVALTRSLTVQLLSRLRQEGFDYFAAETLAQTDTGLPARGYPTDDSGFYTREPIYAEMVRTALKLGFKVVAYEATSQTANNDQREAEQAQHLYHQVFEKDPNARLVVNAGFGHIVKSGPYLGGMSMAEHLYKLARLPMLAVEQTMLYPRPVDSGNHPYYTAVMDELHPNAPVVFVNAAGEPWSLQAGYDVSVFFAPEKIERGRPTWLALGGLRVPRLVNAFHCQEHYPCLIEARYSNEGPDAVPADRLMLQQIPLSESAAHIPVYGSNQGVPSANLYLRPGAYKLTVSDSDGQVLHRENITVTDASR